MKVTELSGGIIYIEDAIPLHKEFLEAINQKDISKITNSIIPEWSVWSDGEPINNVWTATNVKGLKKNIDWDYSINNKNGMWPRINVGKDYSPEHSVAYDIIKMIDEPYKKALDIWCEKTGNSGFDWVTKNYTIKKYDKGKSIGRHTDRDNHKEFNTFDWTALIYLNDDFIGGDVVFNDLGHRISPTAGSILFFPTDEAHTAEKVDGQKCFIFLYIQSKYNFSHSIDEKFFETVNKIKDYRKHSLKFGAK
jgi:hypothetical protein